MTQNPPWHNENPLTAQDVQNIIADQFPKLCPVKVKPIGEGWDNTTWKINNQFVFRFPKHNKAAVLLKNELQVLPMLARISLPCEIPVPQFIGKPNAIFPHFFYGHRFLRGETADSQKLNNDARHHLAKPIAQFLRQLHNFPLLEAQQVGIGYDEADRINPVLRVSQTSENLTYLVKYGLICNIEPWQSFFQKSQYLKITPLKVLSHGDFYAKHLLLNKQQELTAIIDWGDAEILHPSLDLAIVYQFLPPAAQKDFWLHYGEVDHTTRLLAKLRAIYSGTTIACYAHKVNNPILLQEGLQGLKFIAEML